MEANKAYVKGKWPRDTLWFLLYPFAPIFRVFVGQNLRLTYRAISYPTNAFSILFFKLANIAHVSHQNTSEKFVFETLDDTARSSGFRTRFT